MRLFKKHQPIAVRTVDLRRPLQAITDVAQYTRVRIFVTWDDHPLGSVDIENHRQPVSISHLRQAMSNHLTLSVLEPDQVLRGTSFYARIVGTMAGRYGATDGQVRSISRPLAPSRRGVASRQVDLSQPLRPLSDIQEYACVRVIVRWQNHILGAIEIANHHQPLNVTRLRDAIINGLGVELLEIGHELGKDMLWNHALDTLARRYIPAGAEYAPEALPAHVSASIVVATLDRPDDLRACLQTLLAQVSPRRVEIVVVDNNPSSGLTPPVVAEFPSVVLVQEPRKGLAYARNAGFVASTGDIVIATDDDVLAPPTWLESLVTPFARDDVMIVTGNVLPFELETPSQQFFELYGGLGRGYKRFEVGPDWFDSFRFKAVPTWLLGATANAAFRATIFSHPQIGLMEEALGPGMPSGVGEDTYLFYKILKAGYTLVYEPKAAVWHKHRRTMEALRNQLYNYSKGGIAYHLTTLLNDSDFRGLFRIVVELPMIYRWRVSEWLHGRSSYPMSLLWLELRGNLAGFQALWLSRQRVRREGRSERYIPPAERQPATLELSPPSVRQPTRHPSLALSE